MSGNKGSPGEVFTTFLKLGLTSFGGPIAHLGYFRREIVEKRGWVTESQYGQLLAICQFLPGPASSQLGFALGLLRSGWPGAIAAFLGFTAPSAFMLIAFATFLPHLSGPLGSAAIHGLKIVAFAVVAHGVLGMLRQLCPDTQRIIIATLSSVVILTFGSAFVQLVVVGCGGVAGILFCRSVEPTRDSALRVSYSTGTGLILLGLFAVLLVGLPILARESSGYLAIVDAFYRAGALVFGGGHVVLPLLEEYVVTTGWVSQEKFLAGYGAAQAVPGPMFSFAAYLGAIIPGGAGDLVSAILALVSIFLPGFLLVAGILPYWRTFSHGVLAARAIAGINAAVVGLLGAALYDPIFVSAIKSPVDLAIGIVAFMGLATLRLSALLVVSWCVAARVGVALLAG